MVIDQRDQLHRGLGLDRRASDERDPIRQSELGWGLRLFADLHWPRWNRQRGGWIVRYARCSSAKRHSDGHHHHIAEHDHSGAKRDLDMVVDERDELRCGFSLDRSAGHERDSLGNSEYGGRVRVFVILFRCRGCRQRSCWSIGGTRCDCGPGSGAK